MNCQCANINCKFCGSTKPAPEDALFDQVEELKRVLREIDTTALDAMGEVGGSWQSSYQYSLDSQIGCERTGGSGRLTKVLS